jgi:hypothetical protein
MISAIVLPAAISRQEQLPPPLLSADFAENTQPKTQREALANVEINGLGRRSTIIPRHFTDILFLGYSILLILETA